MKWNCGVLVRVWGISNIRRWRFVWVQRLVGWFQSLGKEILGAKKSNGCLH